jgi:integrase
MAKRAHGEGTLSRKENGTWQCQIMVGYKPDGRRDIRTFSGKTQKEVKAKRDEFLRKKEAGLLTGRDIRFDEFADLWYEHHKENVKPTTAEGYRYTLRLLKNHFGRRKLSEIKAMDIEQFLRGLRKEGRSDSALAQCRGMLFQIFKKAVANDYLMKNPVEYAEKMKKGPPKRKNAFTADEVRYLMESLPEDKIGWSIRLMLATGMRTQELLGLEPRHIAKDGSTITIEQALVRIKGSVAIGTPKSYDSYRTIPVPPMAQYCARLLRDTEDKFVWNSPKKADQPCNPSYFADQFKKTLEQVDGVRVLTPHCCRHTYVSQLQALGVSIETIQSIVGHADMDMTRHYLHVQENIRQEAVTRFSEAFSKNGGGTFGNVLDYKKSS